MSDPIPRLNAALEGRYRVDRQIGEGGMAFVYLAEDLRHHRKVALKVLKPELSALVGAERFLGEIETTAKLTHPHILPLHDSGEADGFLFFVTPYLEGETLRDRIDREKQLPVDEAVALAGKVAGALQYAHDHGVIHRDIKPGNILLQNGEPVVADFGIALAVGAAGGSRLTETGLSVGTPYYMSPEQATGDQTVGPASDIYALACVLYEMLVGEPPYPGTTAQAVLGKIIQGLPVSATAARKSVPANVDAAIRKALEKLPADRFTGAQNFAKALADTGFHYDVGGAVSGGGGAGPGPWKALAIAVGAVAVLALVVAAWSLRRPLPRPPVSRLELSAARGLAPAPELGVNIAISPDGSTIAFVGTAPDGGTQIWLRPLDQLVPEAVPGTEGGLEPRFSPDGRSIAFAVAGQLVTVSPGGAPPQVVVPNLVEGGEVWASDGMIYYSKSGAGIWRVPGVGGEPEEVTTLGPEETEHAWLDALPDASALLFTKRSSPDRNVVSVLSLDTGEITELFTGTVARYAPSGHIVYVTLDGQLLAVPFDPRRLEVTGPPRTLLRSVWVNPTVSSEFAVSESGALVYLPGDSTMVSGVGLGEFIWVTRSGEAEPVDPGWRIDLPGGNYGWRLSPGGERVAVSASVDGNTDVWIKQLPDGPFERLTFDDDLETNPAWTPDAAFVAYSKGVGVSFSVWQTRADGAGVPTPLLDDQGGISLLQPRWSGDGEWLVARTGSSSPPERDVVGFRPGTDDAVTPLVATAEFAEEDPALSPDGRWLAYSANDTGRFEVYVRPFPDVDSGRVQASTGGGIGPVWAPSGDELFFVDGTSLIAARVETGSTFRVLQRETLFELPTNIAGGVGSDFYDVAPDGQRFLFLRAATTLSAEDADRETPRFVVVQNFVEELREVVPN